MPSLQHAVVSRVLPLLRRNPPVDDLPALRAELAGRNRTADEGPPPDVRRTHEEAISNVHGFPVFTLWPEDEEPRRSVVYLHGGAYVRPSHARHWRFATRLADALGARAVVPAYPLAPEFTVEDSFEELVALLEEVAEQSPDGVVLAGDSAGGGYALALAQALRERGGPQPDRLVLIAPWVDLTGTTPGTVEAAARDPWLSHPHLSVYAELWAGSPDPAVLADPRVSPGRGDLAGLPPAMVLCGDRDLLKPGCDALFERAEEAGWSLEYVEAPGLDARLPPAAGARGARGVRADRGLLPAGVGASRKPQARMDHTKRSVVQTKLVRVWADCSPEWYSTVHERHGRGRDRRGGRRTRLRPGAGGVRSRGARPRAGPPGRRAGSAPRWSTASGATWASSGSTPRTPSCARPRTSRLSTRARSSRGWSSPTRRATGSSRARRRR